MQKEKSDNCRSDPQHTCLDNYRNSNNDPGHLQSNGNVTFSELFKLIHILCWSFKNGNREVDGTDGKDNTKNKLNKRSNNNEKPANGKDPTWSVLLIPTESPATPDSTTMAKKVDSREKYRDDGKTGNDITQP
jgi:hypothetical protein